MRRVFERANQLHLPIIVHARTRPDYGAEEAHIILEQLVAAAADVPVQIAHLWGGKALSEPALGVYADAVASGDARFRNLYFDVAELALVVTDKAALQRIADRMRQMGMSRILYGSDAGDGGQAAARGVGPLPRRASADGRGTARDRGERGAILEVIGSVAAVAGRESDGPAERAAHVLEERLGQLSRRMAEGGVGGAATSKRWHHAIGWSLPMPPSW